MCESLGQEVGLTTRAKGRTFFIPALIKTNFVISEFQTSVATRTFRYVF